MTMASKLKKLRHVEGSKQILASGGTQQKRVDAPNLLTMQILPVTLTVSLSVDSLGSSRNLDVVHMLRDGGRP